MPQATIYYHGDHPDYEPHDLDELLVEAEETLPESWSHLMDQEHHDEPYVSINPGRPPFNARLYSDRAWIDLAGEGVAEFMDGDGLRFWSFIRQRYPENRPVDWKKSDEVRSLFEYDPSEVGTQVRNPEYLGL